MAGTLPRFHAASKYGERPDPGDPWTSSFVLGVMVVMVVVMMMVVMMMCRSGERGSGKHHQQQDCGKNLFHDQNVARGGRGWKLN
jgi:hypothetical protein